MDAAILKTLPIFSIVTAIALALAFAPVAVTTSHICPPIC